MAGKNAVKKLLICHNFKQARVCSTGSRAGLLYITLN
jgi:hypothetical protein